ncbi:hypothetical protein SAMN03080615_03662 [Amphritea atlantica]|uniref:Uncharacterized protein n=1 Tax=Amphritea atlantica TaxID=355243 RepID=A0A1H9KU30_9GAMM|nr:hypothetical protein [Amphritea atlantica]SER02640.1 hypothetical protein SAMN03080615_03662 [Amphritea atlantica]
MRILKLISISVVIFFAGSATYTNLPLHFKYEISNWFSRIGTPDFIVALDSLSSRKQSDILREYKNRGHELKCYGNPKKEQRIGKSDYVCDAYIGSAFDNIPARLVSFFFYKNKLTNIRIEFPGSSFGKVQDFLGRKLARYPRLDLQKQHDFGTNIFGKPIMVWAVKHGFVATSAEETPGQKVILLWSSMDDLQMTDSVN